MTCYLLPSLLLGVLGLAAWAQDAETVGVRPYELDWAGRQQDDHTPLVDFEDLTGWKAVGQEADASFVRSREQQIWALHVGKLTYRGTGANPVVQILPPTPIKIDKPFDTVTCWIYGNNWGYSPDPQTPQVEVVALFADADGKELSVALANVNWTEWYLCHRRLTPDQITRVARGATFKGIAVRRGRNAKDRVIFFDNMAVFTEEFKPLAFEPRPARGIPMLPGQGTGTNTGPSQLPFPTRPETILPDNLTEKFKTSLATDGNAFIFTYAGEDGRLTYRFEPKTGTLGDFTARWEGRGGEITPCIGGGIFLTRAKGPTAPERAEPLGTERKGETVESRWRLHAAGTTTDVSYAYRLWKKSLVIDVVALGVSVTEVRYGRATGLTEPRLVTLPYYLYGSTRPAIAVSGTPEAPLFLAAHTDWCLSNGSEPYAVNDVADRGVAYNGGIRYTPKTDGKRNDCFERLFITLSPRFEEVLPNIPNPVSPWKKVTGTRVWRAHGSSPDRKGDMRHWTECHRYGMTEVIVTDHETMWRDGGESFTFRTRTAPKKGGDDSEREYSRFMQDQLGFVYGPYNNFTDFAPVNEFWSTDMVSRTSDNQLQHAWMRCYAPKPARAVEYCAKLSPQIQAKFKFSTAYCDVHTAVSPWERTDYDPRVPGAGTFAAVFYSFGEIMLLQKAAWNGPVYSEGNCHYPYCGLTDGNYAQDSRYQPSVKPWLVDFDLRKLHDLCCNFGMGNQEMFFQGMDGEQSLDRFLAATVAFGHSGFLAYEYGLPGALRSYYMLQQLHSRYTQASAAEIRYVDANGRLLDSTVAVASSAFERSQVVTRYANGCITVVNGNRTERLRVDAYGRKLDLPPDGYAGWTEDGVIEVFSGDGDPKRRDGGRLQSGRADYAATPAYLYVDGRKQFKRFAKAAAAGVAICRTLKEGGWEVIPYKAAEYGFAVRAARAVALDYDRRELGPATLRVSRGLTYVTPVKGAFSYRLEPGDPAAPVTLSCERDQVVAGETVKVRGKEEHTVEIPRNAPVGSRFWQEVEGAWIDFTVAPLAQANVTLEDNALRVTLLSNLAVPQDAVLALGTSEQKLSLPIDRPAVVTFDLGAPVKETEEKLAFSLRAGGLDLKWEQGLKTAQGVRALAAWPEKWRAGVCLRNKAEEFEMGETQAQVRPQAMTCGGVTRNGLFMHPPYNGGTGYAFALFDPVKLPPSPPAAFRAFVGKGDGSDPGDGILYKFAVLDDQGKETVAAQAHVTKHAWESIEADLTPWAGRTIRLKLITDVGPKDNSSGDWGAWAGMRIEGLKAEFIRTLTAPKKP
jgi:hypothetical protein